MNHLETSKSDVPLTELTPEQLEDIDGGWVYETAIIGGAVVVGAGGYAIGRHQGYNNNSNSGGSSGGGGK